MIRTDLHQHIAPKALATNLSKSRFGGFFGGANSKFYPLRFFFCDSWANALPLVGLQYHDVELRITWGAAAESHTWECYANFIYLDEAERALRVQASRHVDHANAKEHRFQRHDARIELEPSGKFLASAKSQGAALKFSARPISSSSKSTVPISPISSTRRPISPPFRFSTT